MSTFTVFVKIVRFVVACPTEAVTYIIFQVVTNVYPRM